MAYAGICGSQNIQSNSDDYFHGVSFDEIVRYSTVGRGDSCAASDPTGNTAPSVSPGSIYSIPIGTPFELCGSATDPDGDLLTFSWEQFDLGPAGSPETPSGNAPIFRSFPAKATPCRTFPKHDDLINNTHTIGEILPTYSRTMHFRLTARDNRSGGGGLGVDSDTVVTVTENSGPFVVTSPNAVVTWEAGSAETVTWDVAGTNEGPTNCSFVDITISEDGGYSYPHIVVLGTPNDGSELVTVPGSVRSTFEARLRIQCSNNIFFDISNVDFEIDASTVIFADGFESGDVSAWATSSP